jgi:hypothetical protein
MGALLLLMRWRVVLWQCWRLKAPLGLPRRRLAR